MTVKELRASLANYPEDAQVFLYSELGECDGFIDKITIDKPQIIHEEEWNEDFAYTPYGCNGDSEAQEYWNAVGWDKAIVFLHSTSFYRNFTDMSRKKGE